MIGRHISDLHRRMFRVVREERGSVVEQRVEKELGERPVAALCRSLIWTFLLLRASSPPTISDTRGH